MPEFIKLEMGMSLSATQEFTGLESYQIREYEVRELVRAVITARADEVACDECFEQLDNFVEMTLAGVSAAQAVPLVQDHLERCHDCDEEFEALLRVLRTLA